MIPCTTCKTPVANEFTVPNEVWNAVVRRGGRETDNEYLCESCYRKCVEEFVLARLTPPPVAVPEEVLGGARYIIVSEKDHQFSSDPYYMLAESLARFVLALKA